jgi:endoglucanase
MFALSWGALSYGPGIDKAKQTKYYDGTLRWGFDWLMKAHPSDDVLVVQVANSVESNGYWGGDAEIPTPRMAWQINATAPGTDAWASAAAAFAMGSMAFSGETWNTSGSAFPPADIVDGGYADQLLAHAKSLYKTAKEVKPYTVYSDSIPHMAEAYGSSNYTDDLVTAALSLAAATDEPEYYADAHGFYTEFALSHNESMWGWESRLPAGYVLFAEIAHARPTLAARAGLSQNLTGWQAEAEFYFDNIVDNKLQNGSLTPGGLLSYGQLSDLNSLQPALAAASLLLRYAPLASTPARTESYASFARTQIDYWLGNNPANAVYMVGLHPNSPKNPHSAPASGMQFSGDNWGDINAGEMAQVLYGGIVGGPLIKDDAFYDIRDDWLQNEIALDYSANAVALAAYALTADMKDPFYVTMNGTYAPTTGRPCDFVYKCQPDGTPIEEEGEGGEGEGEGAGEGAGNSTTTSTSMEDGTTASASTAPVSSAATETDEASAAPSASASDDLAARRARRSRSHL